jgi:DNA invertase Pin-like site-specific DNA recombinase
MENTKSFVCYYRVSTKRQGLSGLGIEAQKTAVHSYTKDSVIISEYTEVESGTGKKQRTKIYQAIEDCKKHRATLVVAKLDRLLRDADFLNLLYKSEVEFICCDNPNANKLTIRVLAAVAEDEAERISKRIKEALAELKKKGVKLGTNNLTSEGLEKAIAKHKHKAATNSNNIKAKKVVNLLHQQGKTLWQIAAELNTDGFCTSTGKPFKAEQVRRLINAA